MYNYQWGIELPLNSLSMNLTEVEKRINKLPTEDKIKIFRKRIQRNKGIQNSHKWTEEIFNSVISSLDLIYPDLWDIEFSNFRHIDLSENRRELWCKAHFVIRFPEFEITNSKGYKHTIKEMFIRLNYSDYTNYISFGSFYGKRMAATKKELVSKYQHSHQSSASYTAGGGAFDWTSFCMGSGGINAVLSSLRSRYTEANFRVFLMELPTYLQWESIEGGPYNFIGRITGREDAENLPQMIQEQFYEDMKNSYSLSGDIPNIDFKIQKDAVRIVENEKFENFLKHHGNNPSDYRADVLTVKDHDGTYFILNDIDEVPEEYLSPMEEYKEDEFYFRGELIEFKVIEDSTEQQVNQDFYIHPKIKNYVKKRTQANIQEKRIRGSISKKYNTTNNS